MVEILNTYGNDYCFGDMPPDDREADDLTIQLLENASGMRNYISGYNDSEINTCAGRLIESGYLRGTIIDRNHCSWSRLTRRGGYYLQLLISLNSPSF